jgi:hypothetical protein
MIRPLRIAVVLAACIELGACGVTGINRGTDPRDTGGANGTIANNNNMGFPGAVSLLSGPTVMNWLTKTFMPDQHKDVPPPPISQKADGERLVAAQDCTNPSHASASILPCQ